MYLFCGKTFVKLRNFWFYALIVWSVIKFLEDWRYRMVKVSVDIFFARSVSFLKKLLWLLLMWVHREELILRNWFIFLTFRYLRWFWSFPSNCFKLELDCFVRLLRLVYIWYPSLYVRWATSFYSPWNHQKRNKFTDNFRGNRKEGAHLQFHISFVLFVHLMY